MNREPVWKSIATTLHEEIAEGLYRTGDKLPTESALAGRFGVNRHTVRRALSSLANDGLTQSKRGAGVFVTSQPMDYPLGPQVRFTQTIKELGRVPGRQILHHETRRASAEETAQLRLSDDLVHVVEGLIAVDNVPVGLATSRFPATLLPNFLEQVAETKSISAALTKAGFGDYKRQSTRITAGAASPTDAGHLLISSGAPILHARSLNIAADGRPLEFGDVRFVGERMTLSVSHDAF